MLKWVQICFVVRLFFSVSAFKVVIHTGLIQSVVSGLFRVVLSASMCSLKIIFSCKFQNCFYCRVLFRMSEFLCRWFEKVSVACLDFAT